MAYKIPSVAKPAKKKAFAFIVPDTHYGYQGELPGYDPLVFDLGLQAIRHYAPRMTHLILLGDFGNCESMSHWAALRADQVFIKEDIALMDRALGFLEDALGDHAKRIQKVYICGNHEEWSGKLEAKYPQFRDTLNLRRLLDLDNRGWTWVRNNDLYQLGDLHFTHGNIRGASTPQKMLQRTGVSTMYGHTHRHQYASASNAGGHKEAHSVGCWASIDPPPAYAQGVAPAEWEHRLTTVQVRANGLFQVQSTRVTESSYCELPDGTELRSDRGAAVKRYAGDREILESLREEYTERYYSPGGRVVGLEPLRGTERRTRQQRARVHVG